jgi:hypothetical protein
MTHVIREFTNCSSSLWGRGKCRLSFWQASNLYLMKKCYGCTRNTKNEQTRLQGTSEWKVTGRWKIHFRGNQEILSPIKSVSLVVALWKLIGSIVTCYWVPELKFSTVKTCGVYLDTVSKFRSFHDFMYSTHWNSYWPKVKSFYRYCLLGTVPNP